MYMYLRSERTPVEKDQLIQKITAAFETEVGKNLSPSTDPSNISYFPSNEFMAREFGSGAVQLPSGLSVVIKSNDHIYKIALT